MSVHLTEHRNGFAHGATVITTAGEPQDDTGIDFSIWKLTRGETSTVTVTGETAWLVMAGTIKVHVDDHSVHLARTSLFDESASCVHVAAGTTVTITAGSDAELAVFATPNTARFEPRIFTPAQVPNEHRGKGILGDTCYRYVRTIFDRNNSDPACELVLGEVVTHPGRWSSYPPHHHPQPEIYHYRFTHPQGYGHGETGEQVFKIRNNDTLKIFDGNDHPQCAAPGYGMYYIWVIRHLPGNPYTVPEFTKEHQWTLDRNAPYWTASGNGS
ncbi:MAG: 5-deoxy-glucuronate isomerase [Azospirillaceae bacterium]|nr:5-deoxy-glucuronate isomerase [Azospirillaceae bacterium]